MTIARVEPLTTARALRGPFDYRLPEAMAEVGVGAVLRVPFGPRRILAVVVEVAESSELPADRLAEPIEALQAGAPADLVELAGWVAAEYCSTPARCLQLILPPGTGASGRAVGPRTELLATVTQAGEMALAGGARLGQRQRALLEALGTGETGFAGAAASAGADRATLRRLQHRGLVETRSVAISRRAAIEPLGARDTGVPRLRPEQERAVAEVVSALRGEGREQRELLLHGVTGSGKTEVYLRAVEAALELGMGAIVLVPEIGMTPQAASRFSARLGDRVAVMHSAMDPGQRFDEWARLRSGEADVCVGPRSAVFAPVHDLGLIVIDEEHDPTYKQEGDPCYDARTVAARRVADRGAVLLAGSATPRPESWLRLPRIDLPERVDGRRLPPVELLDMRAADGRAGPLHARTLDALEEVRRRGQKAIVLVNRRGFSPWLTCRSCGHHWGCPNCDVSLITHRGAGKLVCHHCDHREPLPSTCPECSSVTLARSGSGTERVEALLRSRVAPLHVFRLDSDSAAGRGGHERILGDFERAAGGVLVGTQMVAKGHDFPDVTLSVVLDADATLRFPDFRAEERTFAMVSQLAGRSGRGEAGGRVIVQTLSPQSPAIAAAGRHDAAGFLEGELERRRALGYPPFSSLIRVGLAGEDEPRLDAAAKLLAERFRVALPGDARLLGPAPMFRVRNRHRRRFLVKCGRRRQAVAAVGSVVEGIVGERTMRGVAIGVDVDPQ